MNTPADIIAQALVDAGHAKRPPASPWPIYVNHMPETPDECIVVTDTGGTRDGRLQRTGKTIRHPGWQVRVRALDHNTAYTKIFEVQQALDSMLRLDVDIDGKAYTIHAITQTSDVLPLGQEPNAKRRDSFTLNGTITHKEQ